jgi:hypothetical protein
MRELLQVGDFIRRLRVRMRFGRLSRSPLRLIRFQLTGRIVECDWLARSADIWDEALPREERDRAASFQALQDAISIREMLFGSFPDVEHAELRAFRESARQLPSLIIFGSVNREGPFVEKVTSPVMRAKLMGFKFQLDGGVLEQLDVSQGSLQLISA